MDAQTRTDLGEMSAAELSRLFRSGEASPVEAVQTALERIERFNAATNAFVHVVPEAALAEARASEARWQAGEPLSEIDGAPTSIKELTRVRGIPFRRGSVLGSPEPAETDLEIVTRLRAAGACILGTTASPEFGWKGLTHGPFGGNTVNPWDTSRASGGSSGGAAVAAALNMGVLHEGSDGAGSIRIPSSFCGVFGIKPTFGWVPSDAPTGLQELAHRGPLTRTVEDAALFLKAVSGPSVNQLYGWCPPDVPDWPAIARQDPAGIRGLRIGYARTLDGARVDPQVAAAVERAATRMADLGAIVEEVDPGFASPQKALLDLWYAAQALAVEAADPTPEQRARMDPGLLDIAEQGRLLSARDLLRADQVRAELKVVMAKFHKDYDALMLPTMPLVAFEAGVDVPPGSGMSEWTDWSPFTYPFNMTEQPATSVNCGFSAEGMPIGLQFVGPRFRDDIVLRLSAAYQAAHPEAMPTAPLAAPGLR
ncbi:amidase [Pseudooceanicola sp. CBS1P-1]|uniref:Amidase n=1 Tax=Pseudooceanicola albus TaxID=2692189 RepID=A0A6L7GA36_9RHOB|nr:MULTISPECIES: amidase [Pseudooceanicola]MBT9385956.1 amidase [Pseudooceanicola endophyticus]MXN19623.1 amidase [Pseudooceanicola albus]